MNIYINNKPEELQEDSKLAAALSSLHITSPKGIAIAINNNVIPGAEWDSHILRQGDKITIIKATQGG